MSSHNEPDPKLQYIPPVPIKLIDEDDDEQHDETNIPGITKHKLRSWAVDVHIGDCTLVNGSNGTEKFAVWTVSIQTSSGGHIKLYKRYSEMDALRQKLLTAYPDRANEVPKLPPKRYFGNMKNDFLMKRRGGLEYFLSCVLLNPVLANSQAVRSFVTE